MSHTPLKDEFALLWGAEQIAEAIGIKPRQAFRLLENGNLPARKIGGRWVADSGKLRAFILDEAHASG